MVNVKNIDLTNSTQKGIALVGLALFLVVLHWLLPPFVEILKNIVLSAIYIGTLALMFLFRLPIWNACKQLSWNLTKKLISSNKFWYMYQYYYWMNKNIDKLSQHTKNVQSLMLNQKKLTADLVKETESLANQAIHAQNSNASPSTIRMLNTKVENNKQRIDRKLPKLDFMEKQLKALYELKENWMADNETLKNKIDGLSDDWKTNKELSDASDVGNAFLRKDSNELRVFNESVKQAEKDISDFAANVITFQADALPMISQMNLKSNADAEAGAKLIEEYKQKRIQFKVIE